MKFLLFLTALSMTACTAGINYPAGGSDYPKQVADKDTNFYYYPVKNTLSRKDSFDYGREYKFWEIFNEPNLSLRPMDKEVFRFVYSGWARRTYIILLTENKITIKSGNNSLVYEKNENALTKIEKEHLQLLQRRFPLNAPQKNSSLKRYLDSLIKIYPQLLDPDYYQDLEDKSYTRNYKALDYSIVNIPITKENFDSLVNLINSSGFWTLPFNVKCEDPPTDGDGFSLEANTKRKYQVVHVEGCPGDTTKFTKACQKLIESAHLDKQIHLIWNGAIDTTQLIIKMFPLKK